MYMPTAVCICITPENSTTNPEEEFTEEKDESLKCENMNPKIKDLLSEPPTLQLDEAKTFNCTASGPLQNAHAQHHTSQPIDKPPELPPPPLPPCLCARVGGNGLTVGGSRVG